VVLLEPLAYGLEHLDRLRHGGLADHDRLEAPGKSGVLLDVLTVLFLCGGADQVQPAARQRRLEDVPRVHAPLARPRAHEHVALVNEQYRPGPEGLDLLEQVLHALLELPTHLRPRDDRRKVDLVDPAVAQAGRHIARSDSLGESLDHGRLAHARLAEKDGVVLRHPRQDHLDPVELDVAPHHRHQLALLSLAGQVTREFLQGVRIGDGGRLGDGPGAEKLVGDSRLGHSRHLARLPVGE
jgi:hypothetical protein